PCGSRDKHQGPRDVALPLLHVSRREPEFPEHGYLHGRYRKRYRECSTGAGEGLDVTDGVIQALGIHPLLGRSFNRKDDSPGSPDTVILSYGFWRQRFSGDRSIIGRRIRIDGKAKEVIGVMPQDFRFLDLDPAIIQPLQFDRNKTFLGNFSFDGVARLKPDATIAQADADAKRMLPIVNRTFQPPPGFSVKLFENARIAPDFQPFKHAVTGDIGTVLWVLMGSICIVLLIACANVANLLLI